MAASLSRNSSRGGNARTQSGVWDGEGGASLSLRASRATRSVTRPAKRLAARGYLALPFDFRGYGESQSGGARSSRFDLDVEAAAKEARALGARKVFLVGASIGGSAALAAAAATRPPVAGVVSVSGAADLVGALDAAKRLTVPVLYLAGRFDPQFAADARRLYATTAARDRKLDIIGRGEHGTELVDASPKARSAIESFLRSH